MQIENKTLKRIVMKKYKEPKIVWKSLSTPAVMVTSNVGIGGKGTVGDAPGTGTPAAGGGLPSWMMGS